MLEEYFSIALTSFPQCIQNIGFILNASVVEAYIQLCGVKFPIKLDFGNISLISLRRLSIEATCYGFQYVINNLF